ncbi:hypothetical protein BASA60_008668 [Batrachochytrium salamandrivorans]|nr:hypothetical protein BASA60_008668 [Batrachochytrium salamandrivorans]
MATIQPALPLAIVVFSSLLGALTAIISRQVPDPYMDEIFHIPQAQQYCLGIFDQWDSKLTTPPGLYLISANLHWISEALMSNSMAKGCTVVQLRTLNAGFGLATLVVIYNIIPLLHPSRKHLATENALEAFIISLFPISFFFHLMYYTDSGSTFFVLFAYYLSLQDMYFISALAGAVSIWFRQTNVVWIAFIAMTVCIRYFQKKYPKTTKDCLAIDLEGFVLSFIAFVIHNGGIVLGDKSNHMAGVHIPQLYYFFAFSTFFGCFPINVLGAVMVPSKRNSQIHTERLTPPPFLISIEQCIFSVPSLLGFWLVLPVAMYETIRHFTIEHPFILADNRHYTFYLWKNVFRRYASARYALIPGYMFCIWAITRQLSKKRSVLWVVAYVGSVAATLIPSPLLEFRYFVIPYMLLRLHLSMECGSASGDSDGDKRRSSHRGGWIAHLLLECVLFVAVNVFVFYMFLERPFLWPAPTEPPSPLNGAGNVLSGEKMRFMW